MARILDAAAELFLKDGYTATSIDAILEASGGSKATLYNYFSTKDELFRAAIQGVISADMPPTPEVRGEPVGALTELVVQRLETLSAPRHSALLRLIIAERERFPDLAETYYERGPLLGRRALSQYFGELERRQVLASGTAEEAADFFLGMAAHHWVMEALLMGGGVPINADVIRRHAVRVVSRFFAAYQRSR